MNSTIIRIAALSSIVVIFAFAVLPRARGAEVPSFTGQVKAAGEQGTKTAVLAGGCFWGVDAVFKHVAGVKSVISGYSGGSAATAQYGSVGMGDTGHAESVQVTYDPAKISYARLLQVFFAVAHDPTELNRQGPDSGTQYRSAIFYDGDYQKQVADAYIGQLNHGHVFGAPIVTEVAALKKFYPAEDYHQNYLALNPHNPYIIINDLPKLAQLRSRFPDLYR